jgi:ammonia channel protein AmtB
VGCGNALGFNITGAGLLTGAGAAVLPAGVFKGAPTGISQRCPGAPCSGLRAAVAAPLVVVAGAIVAGAVAAGVLVIVPDLLESSTIDGDVLKVVGVLVGAGVGFIGLLLPEFWQETKANATRERLKSLFMLIRLIN